MKNLRKLPLYLFAVLAMGFASCESENPEEENDGEVITDVTLNFQEVDASNNPVGSPVSFKASDPQGIEVGSSPTIQPVNITRGKRYIMTIEVFNSIENEDITEEILEEADEHQFFFLGPAFTNNIMTIAYADAGGIALGLRNLVTVSSSPGTNNTTMRVVLRHDLNKSFSGASNPNFENFVQAGGETDLDITFPVVIN
ncbi:MAG: hypothetical protein ACK4SF_02755 [Algoriphagus aquaeductus]|uniref:Type 1 periplasmic binding fold superfamily protein n=1 Tax=Algoriphagus aquaeductus TaxID=475299 RepID=A0A326S0L2_9BACT|nr:MULTISPECIES: hypothetical protein [Algoriphagus]PZV87553.1 hypothetical protein CLV31_101430 [Algoriphagus aquaeductus]